MLLRGLSGARFMGIRSWPLSMGLSLAGTPGYRQRINRHRDSHSASQMHTPPTTKSGDLAACSNRPLSALDAQKPTQANYMRSDTTA